MDLFPDPPTTLAEAVQARDAALESVAAGAGDDWAAEALAWLRDYLTRHQEYIPDVANQHGPQPAERRAWGIVTKRALAAGWIVRTGYAPRTRGHCTPGPVYESRLYGSDDA